MERFNRRPLAAAIVMAFSAPGLALAQAQQEQTLPEVQVRGMQESFKVDSNSSATRTDTPLRDIPQFINTVPQAVIRSQGATTLGDALRNVPGISYAAPEGGTQANSVYYLRGFPVRGDIFLDGVRDLGEYNRDLFNVEQVEVLKGASSLTFGRGSPGGVIQQVSKTPGLLSLREVGLELGSDKKQRATADLNFRTGEASALRLNMLAEDSDYYRYPQGQEKLGIAPTYRFGIGERTDVTLSYYYLKSRDITDYGQPTLFIGGQFLGMPPVSPRNYYGFANYDRTEHETQYATLRVDHQIDRALAVRETLRWANYQRQVEATIPSINRTDANGNVATAATPLELLLVNRQHDRGRTRDNDDNTLISQTELTWKAASGAVRHTVLGGLELTQEKLNRWNYNLDANPAAAGIQAPAATTPFLSPDSSTALSYTKTPNQRARGEADSVALYAQDQLELSPQWKALFGLRWEHYSSSARNEDLTGTTPGNTSGPFARTDDMLSGRAGLIWQPTTRQSYYVSAGNAYNPSGELGVYGGTGTNLTTVSQTLDPEETVNAELGGQWDFPLGLRLRSALFRTTKDNARIQDELGNTVLAGKRRVEGIEFEVSGQITPRWDVIGAVAFMTGEILKAGANQLNTQGKRPLGVPSEQGSAWTVYRLGGGWEIGGGAFWSQEKFLDDANTGQIPEYTVWDATVAYVQKKYEVRLNLKNLTDKVYYYGGYENSPNRVLPGQPRSAYVTVRYNFD